MVEVYDVREHTKLKNRVTIVGALVNVFLSIIKIGFGILGQSAALIADGVHSLSDLASDLLVLVAVRDLAGNESIVQVKPLAADELPKEWFV